MKTIRKDWPRVRQYQKSGNTYFSVDLRRKHYVGPKFKNFTNKETALMYASDIGAKVLKSGIDSISSAGADPRIVTWTEQFAIYGKTLEEAIAVALGVFETQRKVKDSPFMGELLTLWIDHKTTNTLKPLRERTSRSLRHMADMFKKDFGETKIKEIDRSRVENYLKGKDVSNQTRENIRNYLGQFFNWAKRNNHHTENPADKIEIQIEANRREFFKVDQCIEILRRVNTDTTRILAPYFSICLFAGVRPLEAEQLTWKNIDMKTKEVFIPASISKTKKDRMFIMSENLFTWLSEADNTKPLIPINFRKLKEAALLNLSFEWIADGLRHSFSTYHYAKHKNLEELRHIMGNSPEIIEKFYKGVISHTEIEKFWNITPKSVNEETIKTEKAKRFINV